MLKLAIAAGITLSAILCGMMTLRSNGLFQSNNKNQDLVNDIKEIFGLYPLRTTSNAQSSFKSGESSSFSLDGSGGGGGYLPPKSLSEDDNSTADITTPIFRIFILSTSTNDPPTTFSSTTASTKPASSTTPTTISSSAASPKTTPIKEETVTEGTTGTVASLAQPPPITPTPYAFQGNPSPGFKIDLIWSTLVPPSLSNSENEVVLNGNANTVKPANNLANNGLYLPPNKEYLPPKH